MTRDEWQRVRDLFEAALDVETPARAEWLHAQAAAPGVKAEVASLIDHHSRAGAFLEEPVAERVPALFQEADALEPGATLGHYTIVREIGRGAMGRVYLADDVNLGRVVALKLLAPQFTGDPSYRERLRREARAAAGMTHPGICVVYALDESDGQLFIVSEFVDGHTLRDEIARNQAPGADMIASTARQLAEALAAAHAGGITHRDFKPENVMRDRSGRLRVLDFGLAFSADSGGMAAGNELGMNTLPGALVGTPAYMAPEQLNGERADARADVFAYGVVMYEYACGAHPFGASTPLGLLARVLEGDAQPLADRVPHIPAHVTIVVDRCLRKSAVDRFGSAVEIVAALQAGKGGVSTSRRASGILWWRAHQSVLIGVYACAGMLAWSIKEVFRVPLTLWLFIALGIWAATGGIARAHLLFTSAINPGRLRSESLRVRRTLRVVDLLIALGLAVDGLSMAPVRPLWGVLTVGLAVGVALATLLMEPGHIGHVVRMIAVEITQPGGPDVLVAGQREVPSPGPGDVLIRVAAAGVNRPDVMQRMGHYPPPPGASEIPGLEVAGTIVTVGANAGVWRPGDRVCALVAGGGYAEYCVAPAPQCLPIPQGMDAVHAAAIPETFFTVWTNLFDRGRLQAGESVLVHGGSSGIGTTAIQLARARSSRVFATAGSAAKCEACERLGADRAFNYRETDFVAAVREATGGRGVDVVLDMVGGDYLPRNLDVLAADGRLVQIAVLGGVKGTLNLVAMMQRRLTLTGSTLRARPVADKAAIATALRASVWPLLDAGTVRPVIHATFPLARAADAHRVMESGLHIGKLVLVCGTIDDSRP